MPSKIKHFRGSEYSPGAAGGRATKLKENLTVSDIDKQPQPDVENRLLPVIYVIEKGNPVISVTPGPSTSYILEGEGTVEDVDNPGEVIRLIAGDVIISEAGTKRRFSTNTRLKGFAALYIPGHMTHADLV